VIQPATLIVCIAEFRKVETKSNYWLAASGVRFASRLTQSAELAISLEFLLKHHILPRLGMVRAFVVG
jgi:hypothetical protein